MTPYPTYYRRGVAAISVLGLFAATFLGVLMTQQTADAQPASQNWIEKSNANAQVLLEVMAQYTPEFAGQLGVSGLDEEVFDLKEGIYERSMESARVALAELKKRLATETDPKIKQDLEILIGQCEENIEGNELQRELMLPYFDLNTTIFRGIRFILDDQVPAERRSAALVRLKKYAGMMEGYEPITQQAEARTRERLEIAKLIGPSRAEVEKNLATGGQIIGGIGPLFENYEIDDYQEALEALQSQLASYEEFIRTEVLPRAREDFRDPPEIYAHNLKQYGVDMEIEELISRSQVSFREIQNEMQSISILVAKEKGFDVTDYRDVIRELKKKQLVGEAILPFYEERAREIDEIIIAQSIITIPDRPMKIRLASEAESAALPAPHMEPPRLIGNTGEMGTFVLPLRIPSADGSESVGFDDFTFDAAGWTLTVHEGRPGHELQFAALVEMGVSIPRAIFAFNSVNVEGWALYTEAEMKPYLPLDGQLISLQHRLMRAARAYLDPSLQLGRLTKEDVTRILTQEVVVSEAMALQEVERYTFRAPGQATSYFVGYQRIMEIRTEVERALGEDFNRKEFHDFILSQGLLPPALLRQAIMEDFIPRYKDAG